MLILTRKLNQSVIVGNGLLKVTVVEVRGDKVRIGFEAAESLPIYREEIWLRMQAEGDAEPTDADADEETDDDLVEQVQESIDHANL